MTCALGPTLVVVEEIKSLVAVVLPLEEPESDVFWRVFDKSEWANSSRPWPMGVGLVPSICGGLQLSKLDDRCQ
jgi:hypothetical protein